MKLLVMSDTHGRLDLALKACSVVKNVDMVVHLGDMAADAAKLGARLGMDVVSVNGNCDLDFSKKNFRVLETEAGKILLVHGHNEGVKSGLLKLFYRAGELGCRAALYGHTHLAQVVEQDGVLMVNPGSLGHPWPGEPSSYAVVNAGADGISASVVYIR